MTLATHLRILRTMAGGRPPWATVGVLTWFVGIEILWTLGGPVEEPGWRAFGTLAVVVAGACMAAAGALDAAAAQAFGFTVRDVRVHRLLVAAARIPAMEGILLLFWAVVRLADLREPFFFPVVFVAVPLLAAGIVALEVRRPERVAGPADGGAAASRRSARAGDGVPGRWWGAPVELVERRLLRFQLGWWGIALSLPLAAVAAMPVLGARPLEWAAILEGAVLVNGGWFYGYAVNESLRQWLVFSGIRRGWFGGVVRVTAALPLLLGAGTLVCTLAAAVVGSLVGGSAADAAVVRAATPADLPAMLVLPAGAVLVGCLLQVVVVVVAVTANRFGVPVHAVATVAAGTGTIVAGALVGRWLAEGAVERGTGILGDGAAVAYEGGWGVPGTLAVAAAAVAGGGWLLLRGCLRWLDTSRAGLPEQLGIRS